MAKIPGLEGSYSLRPDGKYAVKFCTGWNESKGAYGEVKRIAASEDTAVETMSAVTRFLREDGGEPQDIALFLDKLKGKTPRVSITFDQAAQEFLGQREANPDISKRTVDTNKTHINRVYPFIGVKPIRSITPDDVQRLLNDLRNPDHPLNKGRGASGTYAEKIYATLKQVFEFALKKGYVKENIVKSDEVSAPQRDTEEKVPLSAEQASTVMKSLLTAEMNAFEMGLALVMMTGSRLSEMLALTWEDYDEQTNTLTVRRSMERDTQKRKNTKNKEVRTIPLMPLAKNVVLKWRDMQQTWFSGNQLQWSKKHPICHSRNAKHILSSTYERWWRQNRDRLGIPNFATIHTMRHTFSTLLIVYCGADTSTVQALTGHEKPDVLLEIYTHTHQGAKLAAMTKLQDFLFPYNGTQDCRHCKYWCASPDGMQEKGVCWESGTVTLAVCPADHECTRGKFQLKTAA